MTCTICYDNDINNYINCRVCSKSICNNCLANILLSDENFTFCIIKNLPIIYHCCYCKSGNILQNNDKDIQTEIIDILEKNLNIKKI